MNDKPADLGDFFNVEVNEKSEALKNLDRAAILGISTLTLVALVTFSLIFLSI